MARSSHKHQTRLSSTEEEDEEGRVLPPRGRVMPILRCTPEKAAARKKREKRVPCVAGPIGSRALPFRTGRVCGTTSLRVTVSRYRWLGQRSIDDRLPNRDTQRPGPLSCSRSSSRGLVRRACQTRGASWGTSLRASEPQHKESHDLTGDELLRSRPPGPETQKDRLAAL